MEVLLDLYGQQKRSERPKGIKKSATGFLLPPVVEQRRDVDPIQAKAEWLDFKHEMFRYN